MRRQRRADDRLVEGGQEDPQQDGDQDLDPRPVRKLEGGASQSGAAGGEAAVIGKVSPSLGVWEGQFSGAAAVTAAAPT